MRLSGFRGSASRPPSETWETRNPFPEPSQGCEAVIHLVGIIQPGPGYSFKSVHVEGTRNVVEAAKAAGTVRHFIYQSALGTGPDAKGGYYETKYAAEGLTKASGIEYTITRPSIIFGKGDGFTAKMVQLIRQIPGSADCRKRHGQAPAGLH